jgi:hypothetical protein
MFNYIYTLISETERILTEKEEREKERNQE